MRVSALTLGILLLFGCASVDSDSVAGLWVWHEEWQPFGSDAPKLWTAPGIVLNFCDDGDFRMATGVLYRTPRAISLGSSDGLSIYRGTWRITVENIEVTYKLIEAEIRFTGYEQALKTEILEIPHIENDRLIFTFHNPANRKFDLQFERGYKMLSPRFVECSDEPPAN